MTWLRETLSDKTNRLSTSRTIAFLAGTSMSLSNVMLTIGAFWHTEMVSAIIALAPSLALLAGGSYMMNVHSERKNDVPN